jgi:hydroxymethylpyrimidine/phosphomethylpyrimidine kinase
MARRVAVLVIAGSDSSGGAGITRDAQVLADFGVKMRCVVTAATAQTPDALLALQAVPPGWVTAQLQAALASGPVDTVKIGMLGNAAIVDAVASALPSRAAVPMVLDPVLVSSSGGMLLDEAGRERLRCGLLPRVTLLTPNIPEAAALLGEEPVVDERARVAQARKLLRFGCEAVLLKGGHALGPTVVDLLISAGGEVVRMASPRVPVPASRGTGCQLASAIAAGMALGQGLAEACRAAQEYVVRGLLREILNTDTGKGTDGADTASTMGGAAR